MVMTGLCPILPEQLPEPYQCELLILPKSWRTNSIRPDIPGTLFNYYADDGRQHEVWFEDARSILAKLSLANEFGLGG